LRIARNVEGEFHGDGEFRVVGGTSGVDAEGLLGVRVGLVTTVDSSASPLVEGFDLGEIVGRHAVETGSVFVEQAGEGDGVATGDEVTINEVGTGELISFLVHTITVSGVGGVKTKDAAGIFVGSTPEQGLHGVVEADINIEDNIVKSINTVVGGFNNLVVELDLFDEDITGTTGHSSTFLVGDNGVFSPDGGELELEEQSFRELDTVDGQGFVGTVGIGIIHKPGKQVRVNSTRAGKTEGTVAGSNDRALDITGIRDITDGAETHDSGGVVGKILPADPTAETEQSEGIADKVEDNTHIVVGEGSGGEGDTSVAVVEEGQVHIDVGGAGKGSIPVNEFGTVTNHVAVHGSLAGIKGELGPKVQPDIIKGLDGKFVEEQSDGTSVGVGFKDIVTDVLGPGNISGDGDGKSGLVSCGKIGLEEGIHRGISGGFSTGIGDAEGTGVGKVAGVANGGGTSTRVESGLITPVLGTLQKPVVLVAVALVGKSGGNAGSGDFGEGKAKPVAEQEITGTGDLVVGLRGGTIHTESDGDAGKPGAALDVAGKVGNSVLATIKGFVNFIKSCQVDVGSGDVVVVCGVGLSHLVLFRF